MVIQSIVVFQGSSLVDLTDLRLLKFVHKNTHEYPIIFKALDKETRNISLVPDTHDIITDLTMFLSALFKQLPPSQV